VKSLGFVVLLAGCGFQSAPPGAGPVDASSAGGDAVTAVDATVDTPVVNPDARACFGTLVNLCFAAPPTNDVPFAGQPPPLDTGVDGNCTRVVTQSGGPTLCVIAGRTITVAGSLVVIGARPLVLLASETISVPGVLNASSVLNVRRGAGANTGICTMNGITGQGDSGGGGGGAGGSLGTAGGRGGDGDLNDNGQPNGIANGGVPGVAQSTPTVLRGGCSGGRGGDSDQQHRGGVGGDGGGAVYLIAGTSITIAGDVFASGAGGGAVSNSGGIEQGGGGGGAGGMIVLEAPIVDASGRVVANGGAGGGGGGLTSGGTAGGDGTTTSWDQRAVGGIAAEANGGNGADGTAVARTTNLDGTSDTGGAGGGAGGLGLVWVYGAPIQNGSKISPAPVRR
jgi:hypothetical protein